MKSIADEIYKELIMRMDAVELAEFIAQHPRVSEWRAKLASLKDAEAQAKKDTFPQVPKRWVTDYLVQTPKGAYKEYKRA